MAPPAAWLVVLATSATGVPPAGAMHPAPAAPAAVPFAQNFSPLEVGVAVGVAASGLFLSSVGHLLLDSPSPGLGVPGPDSLDSRISRGLYRQDGGRLLWGIPDGLGLVMPALPLLYYGVDSLALWRRGQPLLAREDVNAHHRLMAYVEAMGFTYLVTGVVKYAVGRPRPYNEAANDHPQLRRRGTEDNLSFFSGHASSTFAMGAFVAEDLSRAAARHGAGDSGFSRVMYRAVLPYGLGYGVPALVGLSRLVDQQHWPTDVLAGAAAGVLIARLTYALHFDDQGRPRRRRLLSGQLQPVLRTGPGGGLALLYGARF